MRSTILNIYFQSVEDCKNRNVNHRGQMRHVKLNKDIHIIALTGQQLLNTDDPTYMGVKTETLDQVSALPGCECVFTQVVPNTYDHLQCWA